MCDSPSRVGLDALMATPVSTTIGYNVPTLVRDHGLRYLLLEQ